MNHQDFQACIDACTACAQQCECNGSHCVMEKDKPECVITCNDCAVACWAAASAMSRHSDLSFDFCALCATACDACAKECSKHSNQHCKKCAEACLACAKECRAMAHAPVA